MNEPDSKNAKNIVRSVGKALGVLESFTAEEPELRLAEVARKADLDNATAFRMLSTLEFLGYVTRIPDSRRFQLTFKCLDLGFNSIARTELRDRIRPVLKSLVGKVNEAASIGVLEGPDVVYIERVQIGIGNLGVERHIGQRIPAFCSAIGRAIMAFLPQREQDGIFDTSDLRKYTPKTISDQKLLEKALAKIRSTGFAFCDQELIQGVRAIAAPIFDPDGFPVGALSVTSISLGVKAKDFVKLASEPVMNAASEISMGLRASGSSFIPVAQKDNTVIPSARDLG